MPTVSQRAQDMPASPIRKLMPYAESAKERGVTVLHLNIGQPDIESPAEFWKAVRTTEITTLEYSHSAGIAALRAKAAEFYSRQGIKVSADQVVVCTAGSEALSFAMLGCLNPGDEVIVPEPLYANYLGFSCAAQVKVVPLTTRIEDDFRLPPTEAFESKVTSKTKAVLINNPGNPTGTVYTRGQLERLRDLALRHDLFLIADEVYRDFNYTSEPVVSVLELEGLERHAVMVDSVSKRFSLCGARIGFFVSRNAELNTGALKLAQARLAPPTLEQIGVLAALDAPASYFDGIREEYRARRDLVVSRLRAMPGVRVPQIDGAFYAMAELPIDDGDRFCQWLLESFEHQGHTVMFAPASGFYETAGIGHRQVRIAYVLNRERLALAMDCLELALAQYPGRLTPAVQG
jgi:aspartate aminotransferase